MDTESRGFWRRTGEYLGFVAPPPVPEVRSTTVTEPAIVPPPRPTEDTLTVDTALSLAPVFRAVSLIVTSVSQMDLGVFRDNAEIKTPPLIKTPNVNDTSTAFIEETTFSLAAHGNAYWRLYRSAPGAPVQSIEVLDPAWVTVRTEDRDGIPMAKRQYFLGEKELRSHQIKHLRFLRRPGQVFGLGPIQASRGELQAALRLRRFADQWFDTTSVPEGYLTTDLVLSPSEAAEFADAWRQFLRDHDRVGVLSQGLDYKHVRINPAEAQFSDVQQAMVVQIARLFGIPAAYLLAEVQGNSMTYQNIEQSSLIFMQTTLARYMSEIENGLSDLLPRGQRVQFKEEGLLRMDAKTLWEVRRAQVDVGYTTGSELRANEGKAPLPVPESPETTPLPDDEEVAS